MERASFDLVYIADWLPPDFGAVGQYALQFVRERARRGERVAIYGLSSKADQVEWEAHGAGRLKIVRLESPTYDRTRLRARAWWTLKTNIRLVSRAMRDMRAASTVYITGSPPLLLHVVGPLNLLLRKRVTYRITDFYPECLMAEYANPPFVLRLLARLTRFWRRRVSQFEVLGEDQQRRLIDAGIAADRVLLRRDRSPVAITPDTAPIPRPPELGGYKILLYSGNFGVAHDHVTFLEGYRQHHRDGQGRVAIWLNAVGRGADELERSLKSDRLPHLRTRPVPLDELGRLLVTPDAHLVSLRQPFWGYVLPSKIYGCIESRRPIIYIGPEESDVALLARSSPLVPKFFRVANGDSQGVKAALDALSS